MDIRVLNYFLMVAREENVTRASRLLQITQPTLSRQLSRLEEELGVKLFRRSDHSIYLTDEGMLFRRRAQELVDLADKAKSELIQKEETLTGLVSVGCGETHSVKELAKIINGFQEMHPQVKFELYSSNNEDIKAKIEQGNLDLGLLLEPVSITNYNFVRMKTKEQWGVFLHKDLHLASKEAIFPGDLVGTLVVTLHVNTPVHNELIGWSGDFAKEMDFSVTYNVLYNAVIVAREKKGAVICLKLDCDYDDMKFVPLEPKLELSSVLVWKEHQAYSKATTAFIEFIKEKYK
ncbi:LysR family transcriptional regulator [Lacrimispora sp.]|uniref:LysR family transcriptional regulator n=1 Tax=Lacrimispora sp. TaxID=2719234 RepID=UPI002FDB961F